jgi:hypothetical protein
MNLAEINFKELRNDVVDALAAVAEKYGCEVTLGNIKYDMTSIDATLYFKAKGDNGESAAQVEFNSRCTDYGFTPEDYRKAICLDGKVYYLVGFNPRARKNCRIIEEKNGKQFACPSAIVKANWCK